MAFELPALPFAKDALAPYISAETIDFHYGRHHQTYVNNLNQLIINTEFANKTLPEIVKTSSGAIFNNAAQVWNHSFYWSCLHRHDGEKLSDAFAAAIEKTFGDFDKFREAFTKAAVGLFGSGWAWLVKDANDNLIITTTSNAGNPLTSNQKPILTCDVWEHAYYIDYRNARAKYLEAFWRIVDWEAVSRNFEK